MAKEIEFNTPVDNNESGVLSALWRNIVLQLNILPAMDVLISRYCNSSSTNLGNEQSIKKKTKSTLVANITSTGMTFKTFLDLLFNFLRVKKINISVKLTYANGDESFHSINVDQNAVDYEPDEEKESNDQQGNKPSDQRQSK